MREIQTLPRVSNKPNSRTRVPNRARIPIPMQIRVFGRVPNNSRTRIRECRTPKKRLPNTPNMFGKSSVRCRTPKVA